jgi:subtilisin family serine protease
LAGKKATESDLNMEETEVNTQAKEVMTNSRHDMRYRLILAIMVLVSCVAPARAQLLPPILPGPGGNASQRFILRAPGGLGVVQTLCGLIGCGLIESLGDPASQVFVISTSATDLLNNLVVSLLGITHIEPDILISLLPTAPLILDGTAAPGGLSDTTPVWFYGSTVWNGYASQPAADVVRANEARNRYNVAGAGTIGIIDTGVDSNHPALLPVLVPGYDFTRNQAGSASEVADLNQSTVAVLDGGASPVMVNGSTMAVLDQSTVAVLDGHSAFGHGTMVAGIVHLVAPASYIMPLKAFTADGTGYTSDIIRAVYYAVSQQVGALNMSFSMPSQSAELKNALDYAATDSVVSVAAAGNDGSATVVYPAGFQNDVMGVGSTDLLENRSTFSNYGSDVWVAAPGEGIISTYPFGTYAAGWGTSFSAPFVTGAVGLLTSLRPNLNEHSASAAIANADPIGGDLGHGELDVVKALSQNLQ